MAKFGPGDWTVGTRLNDGSYVPGFARVAQDGSVLDGGVYTLANNTTVAATSGTPQVTGIPRGTYIFDVQFTGTSIQLQSLGADGATWRNVGAALTASGSVQVTLGQNSTVRLYNPNGTADTGVYATLS